MPRVYHYIPPEQITNNEFTLHCNNSAFRLDIELERLHGLTFKELAKISQAVRVVARRRSTKDLMISEIKDTIVFEIPEESEYIQNG
jgi:hypothetical protein